MRWWASLRQAYPNRSADHAGGAGPAVLLRGRRRAGRRRHRRDPPHQHRAVLHQLPRDARQRRTPSSRARSTTRTAPACAPSAPTATCRSEFGADDGAQGRGDASRSGATSPARSTPRKSTRSTATSMAVREWTRMKKNDSQECRNCHHADGDGARRSRARRRARATPRRKAEGTTCIDCHFGIAHKEPDGPGPQETQDRRDEEALLAGSCPGLLIARRRQRRRRRRQPRKDKVLNGDAKCTRCHDENDELPGARHRQDQARHARRRAHADLHQLPRRERSAHEPARRRARTDAAEAGPSPSARTRRRRWQTRSQACLTCHQGAQAHRLADERARAARDVDLQLVPPGARGARPGARQARRRPTSASPATRSSACRCNRPSHHPIARGQDGVLRRATTCTAATRSSWCATASTRPATPATWRSAGRSCATTRRCRKTARSATSRTARRSRACSRRAPPFLCQECHSHTATRARPARCRAAAPPAPRCSARVGARLPELPHQHPRQQQHAEQRDLGSLPPR